MKAVGAARSRVTDHPARLAFEVNEQLGARAEATPRCRWRVDGRDCGIGFQHNSRQSVETTRM
jgi:hypothetical protein